jgi:sugar lactone lactonase YvrE
MPTLRRVVVAFALLSSALAQQPGLELPLTSNCYSASNVLCLNKYLNVLPYHFYRNASSGSNEVTIDQIQLPSNYSSTMQAITDADFLVFDQSRASQVLGANPTYDYMFHVSDAVHEAHSYWPAGNKLFMSQLAPPPGYLPQLVVDLNVDPPTISEFLSDPPVYAPNGGTFHNGNVVWAASGGNNSIGGGEQRSGVRLLDPTTNKTTTILNNYFGYYFNTVDDIVVDKYGDMWFTDPRYSWYNALTDTAPQLESASYRFRPSTGAVAVIDDTCEEPNGIAWSPDFKNLYISDTGAIAGVYSPLYPDLHASPFNASSKRTIYKFDAVDRGTILEIANKRPIYLSQDWVPDGLKVAANSMVVTGAGKGVDVLDEFGQLIVRVQTNYTVQNFAWVSAAPPPPFSGFGDFCSEGC